MKIDFAKFTYQYNLYRAEIDEAIHNVLEHGSYLMGPETEKLESELSKFTNSRHSITCSSGTDALLLAMMALDVKPDDEIITTPFTFIATAEMIALLGAKPVFVDIDGRNYNINPKKIERKITSKTKGIISVSLFGQPSDLSEIDRVAKRNGLFHIIDGEQSFGATYKGEFEVNNCDIYTTSFSPTKPLGCYGDGGAAFTNSNRLAKKMRMLRVHGENKRYHHRYVGLEARLDTIQAAILLVKLKHYKEELAKREKIANSYYKALNEVSSKIVLPRKEDDRTTTWSQFTIRVKNRERLQNYLKKFDIPTAVHYPLPLHLQECFRELGYKEGDFPVTEKVSKEIISLPINPYLTDDEVNFISEKVIEFVR